MCDGVQQPVDDELSDAHIEAELMRCVDMGLLDLVVFKGEFCFYPTAAGRVAFDLPTESAFPNRVGAEVPLTEWNQP